MCKISIIVPIYNVEKYLKKCINSILEQTFNEFELILVNDGSTDQSLKICNEYKRLDSRVRVINKLNGGLSSARNAGLEVANGEYIAFVDSDDYIDSDMYNMMIGLAKERNADIVQCRFKKVYDDYYDSKMEELKFIEINSNNALYKLLKIGEINVQCVVSWNKIYKKELFKDIRFPVGKIHEDEFTTYKLFDESKKVIIMENELYYYRQVKGSIMNSGFNEKRLNYLEAVKEQLNYFKTKNFKIYMEVLLKYEFNLKIYYFNVQEHIEDNSKILENIKYEYKSIVKEIIKCSDISIGAKALSLIFFINPSIYKWIQIKRNKLIY